MTEQQQLSDPSQAFQPRARSPSHRGAAPLLSGITMSKSLPFHESSFSLISLFIPQGSAILSYCLVTPSDIRGPGITWPVSGFSA